jgi:hypothetical protein
MFINIKNKYKFSNFGSQIFYFISDYGIIPLLHALIYSAMSFNIIIKLPIIKIINVIKPDVTGLNFLQEPDFL